MPWYEVTDRQVGCELCGIRGIPPCWHFQAVAFNGRKWIYADDLNEREGDFYASPSLDSRGALYLRRPEDIPEEAVRCNGCTTFLLPEEGQPSAPTYCPSCTGRYTVACLDCDTPILTTLSHGMILDGEEVYACRDCSGSYTQCGHCGADMHRDDDCDCRDGCDCEDCNPYSDVIHNYSYKPSPDFRTVGPETRTASGRYGMYDATLYMGFELEVSASGRRDEVAFRLQEALGDVAYLKEDSSISHGFEIVTHPMTLEYAMEKFPWRAIREARRAEEIKADRSCGLHIHASKAAFSGPAHEYRWQLFFYRNQRLMEAMARRSGNDYAIFETQQRSILPTLIKGGGHYTPTNRYSAINTENEATYEVRMFASTVYIDQLKAALQLVESTIEYTRVLASAKVLRDGGFSWDEYVAWLRTNRARYAVLLVEIGKRTASLLSFPRPQFSRIPGWKLREPDSEPFYSPYDRYQSESVSRVTQEVFKCVSS